MKNLVYLMFVSLVMLFGFSRDVLNDENTDLNKAKVPIPMKMETCIVPGAVFDYPVANTPVLDPSGKVIVPALNAASKCFLSGHGTHFGKLQEQSIMKIQSAYLDMNALAGNKVVTVLVYEIRLFAANGDYCDGTVEVRIDRTDPNYRVIINGDLELLDGTGRFEGVTGSCKKVSGVLPCWYAEGTLEYLK